jgi:hypothetical protein
MSFSASRWRAPVTGAVTGLVVAAAVVGSSAFASGGGAPAPHTGAAAGASIECGNQAASGGVKSPSPGPAESDAPFLAAVAQMVQAGTINQAQASVLDTDIRRGRIDPDQLVANGTLSQSQADTVMERMGAVKRSMAPGAQASPDAKAAERKRSQH